MNKDKKMAISLGLIILMLLSIQLTQIFASNPRRLTTNDPNLSVSLLSGTYGDFDGDSEVDDFVVYLEFDFSMFTKVSRARISLTMLVTLPSGYTYIFDLEVWTTTDGVQTLAVYGINCATESGWYDVELYGLAHISSSMGLSFDVFDTLSFDPPQPKGTGGPTAYALFV